MSIHSISAGLYIPCKAQSADHGCGAQLTPFYRLKTEFKGQKNKRVDDITCLHLMHRSKSGQIKNSLNLGPIHHNLFTASLKLHASGASNILLATLSFDCKIKLSTGKVCYEYLTFDLKIPGTGFGGSKVLCYDFLEHMYGSTKAVYAALKYFYELGKGIANPEGHTHGITPSYSPDDASHHQYIRHTEQLLVAYLAHPDAAMMVRSRLHTELRAKYHNITAVKIYHMGLHMFSTKTCCAPCEYSLIGLATKLNGVMIKGKILGFSHNFQKIKNTSEVIKFHFPTKSSFKIINTVSFTEQDGVHKKPMSYWLFDIDIKKLRDLNFKLKTSALETEDLKIFKNLANIEVKSEKATHFVHAARLNPGYDEDKLEDACSFEDMSVLISGSMATKGTLPTIQRIALLRKISLEKQKEIANLIARLHI